MKRLNELYNCNDNVLIKDIKINSKEVEKGDLFVCIKGVNFDRHDYVDEAIKKGANALIVSKDRNYSIPHILVNNTNEELGHLSKRFYDNPTNNLKLIGVTGTDGKTTTASIIRNMLGNNICGYIGTLGFKNKNNTSVLSNTTPEVHILYKYLKELSDTNNKYASMEVSSEALYRNRLNTINFDIAILTNITEDHLNIHKTMKNYIDSKLLLFDKLNDNGVAIINMDDKNFDYIKTKIKTRMITYGKNNSADLVIKDIREELNNTKFSILYKNKSYEFNSLLIGDFNVYNICASIIALSELGFDMEDISKRIKLLEVPEGRCEFINFKQKFNIVLDYAHTPNALKNILTYLNKIKKGRIITVTGSAGGREQEKREEMGKAVLSLSDLVVFTMDDPRYENVDDIINQMIGNSINKNYVRILDREEAIKYAFSIAEPNDIVLIAGKGRDNYMAIEDKYLEYNDYEVIKRILNK